MPYNELNLARITAVQNMDTSTTCNLCLKVVNAEDTSKYVYVLAVDMGGSGLDVILIFSLFNSFTNCLVFTVEYPLL